MSYYNALQNVTAKRRTIERNRSRDAKRALFECEALDSDLFEHDECEALDINERLIRYAIAH